MVFKVKAYIRFLWHSKNQHGIHSPFVYKLITQCFYNKSHYAAYDLWDQVSQELLNSDQVLQVNDVGAGSKVFKSQKRSVSKIAKHVSISRKRAQLMMRIVDYLHIQNALELGTSIGLGSISIAASGQTQLKTVEACPATSNFANHLFKRCKLPIINVQSAFDEYIRTIASEARFDLIYLDGHHDGKATLQYVEDLLPFTHNDSVLILDDIHWSPSMEMAWKAIKNHPEVRVTIDTFQWGLVFFRTEQVKQNFVIRI